MATLATIALLMPWQRSLNTMPIKFRGGTKSAVICSNRWKPTNPSGPENLGGHKHTTRFKKESMSTNQNLEMTGFPKLIGFPAWMKAPWQQMHTIGQLYAFKTKTMSPFSQSPNLLVSVPRIQSTYYTLNRSTGSSWMSNVASRVSPLRWSLAYILVCLQGIGLLR